MNRFILAAAAAVLMAGTASAADLPARGPVYKAAPFVPAFSWAGFYAGLNVGYGFSDTNGTITVLGSPVAGPIGGDGDGVLGGAQIGYNWQFGQWVLGIEADIQGTGGRGNITGTSGPAVITATARTDYFGTVRGRLGYAFDRTMIYATGGLAYGEGSLRGTVAGVGAFGGAFNTSQDFTTYTVGGGIEHMIWDRWSVKAEYLYIGTPDRVPLPPTTTAATGDIDTHVIRGGINYHF